MKTFTISIPKDLKEDLDSHPEINWAEHLKQRFAERIKEFEKFEEMRIGGKIWQR